MLLAYSFTARMRSGISLFYICSIQNAADIYIETHISKWRPRPRRNLKNKASTDFSQPTTWENDLNNVVGTNDRNRVNRARSHTNGVILSRS